MKKLIAVAVGILMLTCLVHAQTPTQIKQILPGTPSVQLRWDYIDANLPQIDNFEAQRTVFSATVTITSPYDQLTMIPKMQMPCQATYAIPTAAVAGHRAFVRMVAVKQGLANSAPSNVVEIQIVPTPPPVQNLNIARFTEIEFTQKSLDGVKLWVITSLL